MDSKQFFQFPLALLILTSFGAMSGVEVVQANPPTDAPAWGYHCNRGERVSDFPGNRDCRQKDKDDRDGYEQGRDRDQPEDRGERDGKFDDRFNRSLIVERIANQDLPPELQGNEVFSVIEQDRYAREPQMTVLRENGEIFRSHNGRTVRIGRISSSEVREFERLLREQDFKNFDRRSYSSRQDREATAVFLVSQDTAVRYTLNVEQLPEQLRRVVNAFERLTNETFSAGDDDRHRSRSGTISAGTRIRVEYPGSDRIVLRRQERRDLSLTVARDVRESRGYIVIPAGSRVEGELRPVEDSTRFIADRLILPDSRDYDIKAMSDIVPRNRSVLGTITRGGRIDVGTILGEVFGGRGDSGDRSQVVVYPQADLDLTLSDDLTIR